MLFTGFTLTILLWFAPKATRSANRFLAMALAVAVLWIAEFLAADIGLANYVPGWSRLSLAFGPLIYFYVLKITQPENELSWKYALHFTPALAEQIVSATKYSSQFIPVIHLLAIISVS